MRKLLIAVRCCHRILPLSQHPRDRARWLPPRLLFSCLRPGCLPSQLRPAVFVFSITNQFFLLSSWVVFLHYEISLPFFVASIYLFSMFLWNNGFGFLNNQNRRILVGERGSGGRSHRRPWERQSRREGNNGVKQRWAGSWLWRK